MRKLFGGRWDGPQFILTHEPPPDEPDPSFTFLSGDIRSAMSTALAAADGRDVLVLGASIVNQRLEADLVDELLGDGVRLVSDQSRATRAAHRIGVQ